MYVCILLYHITYNKEREVQVRDNIITHTLNKKNEKR